jgi:hypothetical protein
LASVLPLRRRRVAVLRRTVITLLQMKEIYDVW